KPRRFLPAGARSERLEMHGIASLPTGDTHETDPDAFGVAADIDADVGPSDDARPVVDRLAQRLREAPDEFDARRDGVGFMETMRREFPRQFEQCRRPAVGGYIQHTTITRTSVRSQVIHHWPDQFGRPIDLDASTDPELRNDSYFERDAGGGLRDARGSC